MIKSNARIIFLGAPGCGKGTLSNYLVKNHGFKHISTGDLFRKTIAENGPNAEVLKDILTKGALVPDEVTNQVIRYELLKLSNDNVGFILDGYPRTLNQAQFLSSIIKIDMAVLLEVPQELLLKRIIGRRICKKCGRIYNIYFDPPKQEGICDHDQSLLVQRKDDDATTANSRIKLYQELIDPILKFYDEKSLLIRLDGTKPLNELATTMFEKIK